MADPPLRGPEELFAYEVAAGVLVEVLARSSADVHLSYDLSGSNHTLFGGTYQLLKANISNNRHLYTYVKYYNVMLKSKHLGHL